MWELPRDFEVTANLARFQRAHAGAIPANRTNFNDELISTIRWFQIINPDSSIINLPRGFDVTGT